MAHHPGLQRVGVVSRLPQVLWELGVDPRDVFRAARVPADAVEDPDASISFDNLDRLLAAAVAVTGCPHVTLLVGQQSSLRFLGPVGELMRHAPTFRRALLDLAENQHRYVRGAVVYLVEDGDTALLGYGIDQPGFRSVDQLTDGAVAAGSRFVRELSPRAVLELLLPRPQPANAGPYERLLGVPVRFGQEHAGLVLDGALLDQPVKGADPSRRAELEAFVRAYWAVHEPSVDQLVRRILRSLVFTSEANLEAVAQRLELHPRTLHRRLVKEGTSFRQILDDVRWGVAQQILRGTNVSITQLALWLGYSEAAAFSHAFRRWTGTSAAEWRARERRSFVAPGVVAHDRTFMMPVRKYQDDPARAAP
ncbi:MAG: AraC family transcriptional regulator [Alsobacter sp.]